MSTRNDRRKFLKDASILGVSALVASTIPQLGHATESNAAEVGAAASQFFAVKIVNNLFDTPVNIQLTPGELSAPVQLKGGAVYRVKVTPSDMKSRFGKVYSLVLADENGHQLDSMNVGSNTTATFHKFGVQVYVMSIQQTGSSATAVR